VVCFPDAGADVNAGAVILFQKVADTDEEYPAIFIPAQKSEEFVTHL
jgi:hypothetical protein